MPPGNTPVSGDSLQGPGAERLAGARRERVSVAGSLNSTGLNWRVRVDAECLRVSPGECGPVP